MRGERNRGKEGGMEVRGWLKEEGRKDNKIAKLNHGKKPNTEIASIVLLASFEEIFFILSSRWNAIRMKRT